tara:strand:- start:763 stop:1740 length:978 start_codon:yes stop_codon:yes gene_type:complete
MDKKILILKNDRVGDLFHSLKNIETLISLFSEDNIELCLSKINIRFANVLESKNLKFSETNLNLTLVDKVILFKKMFINKYDYVFILSPKNFYFYLPLIFKKTNFIGICVDGKRKRPNKFLRKYLFAYEVNDRTSNKKKLAIYNTEKKLIYNVFKNKIHDLNIKKIKSSPFDKRSVNVLFHYKSEIFGKTEENLNHFHTFFLNLVKNFNMKIKISTDLDFDIKNEKILYKYKGEVDIKFLGPINANQLLCEIKNSELIISPHGAITCIAGYYDKNIIDIFDRNITKNAFYEFKPNTAGIYQFIVKPKNKTKLFKKLLFKINNLFL